MSNIAPPSPHYPTPQAVSQIPHHEHLTFSDHIRARLQPKEKQLSFLAQRAASRKAAYDQKRDSAKKEASL